MRFNAIMKIRLTLLAFCSITLSAFCSDVSSVLYKTKLTPGFNPDKFREKTLAYKKLLKMGEYNLAKEVFKQILNAKDDSQLPDINSLPENIPMKYFYYVPLLEDKTQKVPLIVLLHGLNQYGDGDIDSLFKHPQPLEFISPENQKKYPCFFLAPQLPNKTDYSWAWGEHSLSDSMETVVYMIKSMLMKYPNIDPDRIYVTGYSSGGWGTWGMLFNHSDVFAGGAVLCAADEDMYDTVKEENAKLNVWIFTDPGEMENTEWSLKSGKMIAELGGDARVTVHKSKSLTISLDKPKKKPQEPPHKKKKNKKPKVKRINTKKLARIQNHAVWLWAYAEPDLIPWLFAHRREK